MSISMGHSSRMSKKIKRSYFKDETILISCRCTLLVAPSLTTSAKLYVSATALHLVHFPKRRELTSIPFTTVTMIRLNEIQSRLDVTDVNGTVYILALMDNPSSTLHFIVSCWNVFRKEETVRTPLSSSASPVTSSPWSSSGLSPSSFLDNVAASAQRQVVVAMRPGAKPSVHSLPAARVKHGTLVTPDVNSRLSDHSSTSSSTSTTSGSRVSTKSALQISPPPKPDEGQPTDCQLIDRTGRTTAAKATAKREKAGDEVEEKEETLFPADSPPTPPVGGQPVCGSMASTTSLFWPVSWLVYLLVSITSRPPQRFTMVIAYVILAFLMCSTVHLYHRLALFHLSTGSTLFFSSPTGKVPDEHSLKFDRNILLHQLQVSTARLLDLTNRMNDLAREMSRELGDWRMDSSEDSQSPTVEVPPSA